MKFNRGRLILGLYVIAFIAATELLSMHFQLPAWPAYVAWVLFFGEHMNPKSAPPILIGAAVGIGLVMLAPMAIGALARLIDPEWGRLIYILAAVYAIFAFGEMIPLALNSHTFMFFTVAGLALTAPNPSPRLWLLMEALGGGVLIGATIIAGRTIATPATAEAAS
ncbi:MAG TPA: hypothetical protein VMD06_07200 [Steroidobacteraceae bacterium]|nr:hypothetical protein [Steroidobacteraceae bacterium]